MFFRYNVNDRVPAKEMATSGLMWTICSATFVIIFANVVAGLYNATPAETVWYAQKLLVITGVAVILQVIFGHRLPAVYEPSAILLTAAVTATDFAPAAFSTALVLCGAAGMVIARTGLLARVAKLFTPRVIGTVLTLIPLTLVPTFAGLIANPDQPGSMAAKLIFAFVLLILIFAPQSSPQRILAGDAHTVGTRLRNDCSPPLFPGNRSLLWCERKRPPYRRTVAHPDRHTRRYPLGFHLLHRLNRQRHRQYPRRWRSGKSSGGGDRGTDPPRHYRHGHHEHAFRRGGCSRRRQLLDLLGHDP